MFYDLSRFLRQLGFSSHLNGYAYSRRAILLAIRNPKVLKRITGELYPSLANYFQVSSSSVERCMRNSIENAWLRGDLRFNYDLFQNSIDGRRGKPTNAEFLSVVSEYFLMNYQAEALQKAVSEELDLNDTEKE